MVFSDTGHDSATFDEHGDMDLDLNYDGENYKAWLDQQASGQQDSDETRDAWEKYQMDAVDVLIKDDAYLTFCQGKGIKPNSFLSTIEYKNQSQS